MPDQITDKEFGRRLSAARGYSPKGRSQKGFASFLGIDRGRLSAYEAGEIPALKRPGLRQLFAEKTGLPEAFFVIDLRALPEMAEAERLVRVMTPSEQAQLEARLLEQDLDDGIPPGASNESSTEESKPESGSP